MTVGTWDPQGGVNADRVVPAELIARFLQLEAPSQEALADAGLVQEYWVMALTADAWQVAESLGNDELEQLIRLFTQLEVLPGWEAGKKSPVIPLVKMLKGRDSFSPELRKWIKANTDNRYLPYGSAL